MGMCTMSVPCHQCHPPSVTLFFPLPSAPPLATTPSPEGAHGDCVPRPRVPGPAVHQDRGDGARRGHNLPRQLHAVRQQQGEGGRAGRGRGRGRWKGREGEEGGRGKGGGEGGRSRRGRTPGGSEETVVRAAQTARHEAVGGPATALPLPSPLPDLPRLPNTSPTPPHTSPTPPQPPPPSSALQNEKTALQWAAWEKQQKEIAKQEEIMQRLAGGAQSGRASQVGCVCVCGGGGGVVYTSPN